MSLYYQILEEHKELLESKGYTEQALHSPDKEGWFARQLQIYFSIASNDAHKFNEKNEFDLKGIGFFNDEMDMVIFRFHYEYNPGSLELNIKSLCTEMDGEKKDYCLNKNEDLPSSTDAYKQLSQQIKFGKARVIAGHINNQGRKRL